MLHYILTQIPSLPILVGSISRLGKQKKTNNIDIKDSGKAEKNEQRMVATNVNGRILNGIFSPFHVCI